VFLKEIVTISKPWSWKHLYEIKNNYNLYLVICELVKAMNIGKKIVELKKSNKIKKEIERNEEVEKKKSMKEWYTE